MRETGFLIEAYHKSATNTPMYLRLYSYKMDEIPKPEWTDKPDLALRFARELDAQWCALLWPSMCCLARITEHIWLDDGSVVSKARQ